MSLKEQSYSVLVVSASEKFNYAMKSMLPAGTYQPVIFASSIAQAQRETAERAFDFVIINSPLANDLGLDFAIDASIHKNAVVLFLINNAIHDEIYERVYPYGVLTLPKPMPMQSMETALRWMRSTKELTRRYQKKTTTAENKIQEIRLVNRAKWLLISNENMPETEAHRFFEKNAMDRCITKGELAREIIEKYS